MRRLFRNRFAVTIFPIATYPIATMAAAATLLGGSLAAHATTVTACTALNICYCINPDNKSAIDASVARVRQLIADQKAQGKAIGYLSVPLSTSGGGYFGVNRDVAQQTKEAVEKRFGARSVWMLNPGAEGNLPAGASGADYMLMWTTILEGQRGVGDDFDLIYFVGPTEFARFLGLTGESDLTRIDAAFDQRLVSDPDFKKAVDQGALSKASFRSYYGLKASVSFSYGSHDEWNIARLLNERRRGAGEFGIANQLPILFDGQAVNPSSYETPVSSGDVGRCIN
jgi:hypothetical protein